MALQVSFGKGKDIDRLSSLPDDIICHIISFLPLKEAIRTSILSTRWRYLFVWTFTLTNIDDSIETCPTYRSSVLVIRQGNDVARVNRRIDFSFVDGWIYYALRHGVEELELCISTRKYNILQVKKLPSWLFTCKTLVRLELKYWDGYILEVPDTVCLPKLKVLHLQKIELSHSESVQRLISRCCMLEELLVQYCEWGTLDKFNVSNPKLKRLTSDKFNISNPTLKRLTLRSLYCGYNPHSQLVINAPSLVYLEHFDLVAGNYSLLNLQCLVEAHIEVRPVVNYFYHTAAPGLLRGISNVQSLYLGSRFTAKAYGLHGVPIKFPNLTYLKIKAFYCYNWESLLDSTPCLETLVIELEPPWLDVPFVTTRVPSCLLAHLKAIKFLSFHGKKEELQLVEYFLMNAQVLQTLTVGISEEKKLQPEITEALGTLPRVSKKCNLTIV